MWPSLSLEVLNLKFDLHELSKGNCYSFARKHGEHKFSRVQCRTQEKSVLKSIQTREIGTFAVSSLTVHSLRAALEQLWDTHANDMCFLPFLLPDTSRRSYSRSVGVVFLD